VHDTSQDADRAVLETKRLLAEGMGQRSLNELSRLLANVDLRVRQEAQFALADRGLQAIGTLESVALKNANSLARLHGIWGLGQVCSKYPEAGLPPQGAAGMDLLVQLLSDDDAEVRAQAAKVLGDRRYAKAYAGLKAALKDKSPRVRFFAAVSVGKYGRSDAMPELYSMLRENVDKDPLLRHAGVMGLVGSGDVDALLATAHDESDAVRMGDLLALRRLKRPEVAWFLNDKNPALVLEAARAINDEPINGALPELAALIDSAAMNRFLAGEPLLPPTVPKEAAQGLGLEALLRRVLNANFHFGTPTTARGLAGFAARSDAPANMRVEALEELADWEHPAGIDRVVGLWRPVAAERHSETAAEALEPRLADLLHQPPEDVQVAALRCVRRLRMSNAGALLSDTVADSKQSSEVRAEALRTIAALDLPSFETALDIARKDRDEDLRKVALRLEGKLRAPDSLKRIAATLESGSTSEKQTALATLGTFPGTAADELIGQWVDRLQAGSVPRELCLDVLDAAGKRSAESVKQKLAGYEAKRSKDDPLAAYDPAMFGGNASDGKKIFFEKTEAQCVRCHRINGQGGDVGPDLSHVASQKDRHYFLESIVLPNKQIAQGFDSVMVVLKDGDSQAGVLKSETPDELVLNTAEKGLVTIKKTEIQSRRAALSPMPEGLGQILSKQDLRNIVEFLSTLK
jgi:quinoprotein glucose dehydrogenase